MQSNPCQHVQVDVLRRKINRLEGGLTARQAIVIASGFALLDQILPEKGFRGGTLVEWLSGGEGSGASTLALATAAGACRDGGGLVVIDGRREFHPPAAIERGIEPSRMIVVQPDNPADDAWALDQSLRCPAVSAVVAWPESLGGKLDERTFRRLQLAVEKGGGLGLLIRSESVRHQPSWADVRLLVEPMPTRESGRRRLKVLLLRCRGGTAERQVEVEIGT